MSDTRSPYMKQRFAAMLSGTKPQAEKKAVKMNLGQWFQYQIEHAPDNCEISGEPLGPEMVINPRSICCHILAKSKFPSIATATFNCFWATNLWHVRFDQMSSDEIKALAIYPTLVERLKTCYNLLTEAEKAKLPDCFRLDKVSI